METTKVCKRCQEERPLDKFHKDVRSGGKIYQRHICKICTNADARKYKANRPPEKKKLAQEKYAEWRKDNYEAYAKLNRFHRWKNAGIDPAEAESYFQSHNGECDLCGLRETVNRSLAVDHCHDTGKIRGMLCQRCNRGLGFLRDDPELLAKAIIYLQK